MKRMTTLGKQVLLALTLAIPAVQSAYAGANIGIDARSTGPTVSNEMFGANYLFTTNRLGQLENAQTTAKLHTVRFPGGGVAESAFNPVKPSHYMNGERIINDKSLPSFIKLVNKYNWKAAFVLPTIRYRTDHNRGAREIEQYVERLLRGDYGTIENGRTIHFEVGNEFYWNSAITSKQYGQVARRLVSAIHSGISKSGRASRYNTEVSVQSGNKDSDARIVASEMKNMGALVDYFTFHWYPGRTEIQLGLRQMDKTKETFDSRMKSVANEWQRYAGYKKPFFLSEYNIVNSARAYDVGQRSPMGIMSIFAGAVRADTRMSTVWPFIAWDDGGKPTKYYKSSPGDNVAPTTNSTFFRWMRDSLRGSRIVNGISNDSYTGAGDFRQGVYAEAFRKGSNKMVVYVFGTEGGREQVTLKFKNFTASSVRADTLYAAPGQETNADVVASKGRIWPRLWSGNRYATFTVNKQSRYEVVKLEFTGSFQ